MISSVNECESIPPAAAPRNEPLQIYNPFAKIYDQQNGSGYFHNVCKTLSVKKE